MGLTLEQIRQQFNIPKNVSDAEVIRIATEQNIIIDFTGSNYNQSVSFGANENIGLALNGSSHNVPASGAGNIYGDMGLELNSPSQNITAPSSGDMFGDMGLSISRNPVNPAVQNDNRDNSSPQISVDDLMQNPNLGEIRLVNGKMVAFDKNGNELTDTAGRPLNIAGTFKEGLGSIEFEDGKVIQKNQDGNVIRTDDAAAGQVGYKKDGESIEERLARFYYASYKTDPEGAVAKIKNMSPEERRNLEERYFDWCKKTNGEKVAKADFYKLVKNTGMDAQHMKDYAITVLHMSEEEADEVIRDFSQRLYTKEDQAAFLSGVVDNVDMAESPEMQTAVTRSVAEAAQAAGISDDVATAIGDAIVANKFHGREATIEALRNQYGLSAEQANDYYANLPEETRQQIEDETLDAISTVQTEVAADESQSEEVRHGAADLSTAYMTYIDDAEYQMQVIQNNTNYIMQNADQEMQDYYTNSIAENAYNYDLSNRDDIIRMVQELGNDEALNTLERARQRYEEQNAQSKAMNEARKAELERKQQAQQQSNNNQQVRVENNNRNTQRTVVSSSASLRSLAAHDGIGTAVSSDAFKELKNKDKEDFINSLNTTNRKDAISSIVENAQGFELESLMNSGLKNEILQYLVTHPSPQNTKKLRELNRYLSPDDREMIRELREERNPNAHRTPVVEDPQNTGNHPHGNDNTGVRSGNLRFGFLGRH
ncbi:hypothetical protein IKE67_01900 [bacterium]|nr:hypothetical protein [bacterium]